jgi:hypothetical protein
VRARLCVYDHVPSLVGAGGIGLLRHGSSSSHEQDTVVIPLSPFISLRCVMWMNAAVTPFLSL